MKHTLLAVVLLACGATGSTLADSADHEGRSWRQHPVWDDGQAEFATYEVRWQHYRAAYAGRAVLALVKEPWAPDLQVKADTPRPDGYEVFKFSHLRDVPTGVYTYHQAATIILRRDSGELVKIATSSAEACGISTAQMRDGVLETHSYFDGQGDRTVSWPAGAWPWEGLPVILRDSVTGPPATSVEVFAPLLTSRFPALQAHTWSLERQAPQRIEVPAGSFEGVPIVLRRQERQLTWVFDAAAPHALLRFDDGRGSTYELAKIERMAYWQRSSPGDEAWYPPHLREGYAP